jgi:nitrate/TMAO reductase-like tetraheme cytochrome c subunit
MEELKIKMEARLEVYESLINAFDEDNKFKTEYEAKAEELKQLLNEMGC